MNLKENLKLFRDKKYVQQLSSEIKKIASRLGNLKLMHVCGTHEYAIVRYGIRQFLPKSIRIIPGPGCPVCVCPVESIDKAVTLAHQPDITVLSFGDMIRVPATKESLDSVRRNGARVKMVYSPLDTVKIAAENPDHTFVFFSVGFETTVVGVAGLIKTGVPKNLYFLIANRYIPPVLELLMEIHDESIQGFLLPGHAAAITGVDAYDFMEKSYRLPCAVTGFEPVDILLGILVLLEQIAENKSEVINAYGRVVSDHGNPVALRIIDEVFIKKPGIWRGIDIIDGSAFCLRDHYSFLDAEVALPFQPEYPPQSHPPGCQCHRIMLGELLPVDCKMFKTNCSPARPYGPCMVSQEGTCHSWYNYGSGGQ